MYPSIPWHVNPSPTCGRLQVHSKLLLIGPSRVQTALASHGLDRQGSITVVDQVQ